MGRFVIGLDFGLTPAAVIFYNPSNALIDAMRSYDFRQAAPLSGKENDMYGKEHCHAATDAASGAGATTISHALTVKEKIEESITHHNREIARLMHLMDTTPPDFLQSEHSAIFRLACL